MAVYHVLRLLAALTVSAWLTPAAHGQSKLDGQTPEKLKLSKAEMTQFRALTDLVDGVMAGKEPAPADVKLSFQNHFLRSATNVFVPYVLDIGSGKFATFPVALYVRAHRKGAATAASEPVFTDIYFIPSANSFTATGQDSVQLSRALELPPGDFEVTFAMSEAPPKSGRIPPKRVVHTQALTVPDFSGGLTTSSIFLARNLEEAPQQLTPRQQMEQPFTIGGQKLTPTFTPTFAKSAELLFMFLIYNEGATPAGKPDIEVGYTVSRGAEAKPFAKMPNTSFNATTLPAEFNLGAGHQVLVAQGVPLASFAPGDYKLAIAIADKTNNTAITRAVPFTVIP
jgi:hypothetical protein